MDNKITKKRLGNLLAYEWIAILIVSAIFIGVWAIVYTVTAVQLTVGQKFKIYFDIDMEGYAQDYLGVLGDNTFSYDVLSIQYEGLDEDTNVLIPRLAIKEGDIIITNCKEYQVSENEYSNRAQELVDGEYYICSMEKLSNDCANYLKTFLLDGEIDYLDYSKLDLNKIDANFVNRMKDDNRFRKDSEIENGKLLERKRIENLCSYQADFEYLLNNKQEIFYKTIRNVNNSQEVMAYGIKLDKLTGGKRNTSEFFRIKDETDSVDTVLMVFDFVKYQPDLQFESISLITQTVKLYSDITLPSMA